MDPLEDVPLTFPSILQGGGIVVLYGDITIQNTNIDRNNAIGVRLLLELSWNLHPVTHWKKLL